MNNAKNTTLFPYLERLLDGEKVEWKTLGDKEYISIENNARKAVNSMSRIPGNTPYYGANNIQDYVEGYTHDGVYVLIAEDGTASVEQYSIQWAEGKFWANNHVHVIKGTEKINNRFLYYFLKTINYTPFLKGGGRAKLTKAKLQEIPFAVPPLRVQARIVEILDKFTQLEAELEAELEARKKQYAYYRDQLLNFSQCPPLNVNIEWKTLGEVCLQLRTGLNPRNNFELNTDDASNYYVTVRELGGTELIYSEKTDLINDHALQLINNRSKLKVNDILFSGTGTIGKTAFIAEEPSNWNIKEGVYALTLDTRCVLPMFVLRYLQSQRAIDWIERMAAGGIVRSITMRKLEQLPFPVPPLSEQRRIVDILDRFDTLTNSISEGLPKEIALRRKQYEYYRDALLNFPRAEATA